MNEWNEADDRRSIAHAVDVMGAGRVLERIWMTGEVDCRVQDLCRSLVLGPGPGCTVSEWLAALVDEAKRVISDHDKKSRSN